MLQSWRPRSLWWISLWWGLKTENPQSTTLIRRESLFRSFLGNNFLTISEENWQLLSASRRLSFQRLVGSSFQGFWKCSRLLWPCDHTEEFRAKRLFLTTPKLNRAKVSRKLQHRQCLVPTNRPSRQKKTPPSAHRREKRSFFQQGMRGNDAKKKTSNRETQTLLEIRNRTVNTVPWANLHIRNNFFQARWWRADHVGYFFGHAGEFRS